MYKEEENSKPEFMKRSGTNPFRTPDGYFDSIEDRIIREIQLTEKKKPNSSVIFRILKPAFGIAASLTLIYFLATYPFTNKVNTKVSSAYSAPIKADSSLNFLLIDESTLVNAIFSDEKSPVADINPDEMLAYLSSGLNEVEIYSEIQN